MLRPMVEPCRCRAVRDITGTTSWRAATVRTATCERMEANEPAFILATSGTTAKPKLAIHTHGGYQVHIVSMGRWCFGLKPDDVWWATSDIGWIVGHSYMVYAPLLAGCTTVVFEGALDHPHAGGQLARGGRGVRRHRASSRRRPRSAC